MIMNTKALFIGSIGVATETSEYQRRAYNQAMSENGLNWHWTIDIYKELLKNSGGKKRLRLLSSATQQHLSEELIERIHLRKTQLACQMIVADKLSPRPGLVQLIESAKQAGMIVAWVTSTSRENTDAILTAANGQLTSYDFDYIFHRNDARNGKPSPAIYQAALRHFGLDADECIAVEDSLVSILAAKAANIFTVATLGAYHDEPVENIADLVLPDLSATNWSQLTNSLQAHLKPLQLA